jgi:hypothetical protein
VQIPDRGHVDLLHLVRRRLAIGFAVVSHDHQGLHRVAAFGQTHREAAGVLVRTHLDLAVTEPRVQVLHHLVDRCHRRRAQRSVQQREVGVVLQRVLVVEERGAPREIDRPGGTGLQHPALQREGAIEVGGVRHGR